MFRLTYKGATTSQEDTKGKLYTCCRVDSFLLVVLRYQLVYHEVYLHTVYIYVYC